MKQFIFTVYDEKANAYFPPFNMPAVGMAIRAMLDALADPEHQFAKHTPDFSLYCLGEFDDATARYETHPPKLVHTFLEMRSHLQERSAQLQLLPEQPEQPYIDIGIAQGDQ